MKFFFTLTLILVMGVLSGQAAIKVEVSADTIRPGELVKVIYTIENGEGKFEAPDLVGLPVISGPNISSSFVIRNGDKSSSQSYTYILRPLAEGNILIPQASYLENGIEQMIEPVTIVITSAFSQPSVVGTQSQSPSSKTIREKKKI